MIYLVVGHRGVGKTLWLKKVRRIFTDFQATYSSGLPDRFLDLDREIEKKTSRIIRDFFSENNSSKTGLAKSEKNFRRIETKTLMDLIDKYKDQKQRVFIAIGAGFKQKLPGFCHIIHLIRETDTSGRVFLDRPRLRKNKTPYKEFMSLYPLRENFYKNIRDESLVLPEWDFKFDEVEKLLFDLKTTTHIKSIITLNKNHLPLSSKKWPDFIKKRISWGSSFFELRDDQLSSKELELLLKIIPKKKQLLSFRKSGNSLFLNRIGLNLKKTSPIFDWPLEKGKPPVSPPVLSLHERKKEPFDKLCNKLLQYKAYHFKLALPVYSLKELMQGHFWFLEDPKRRSFMPVSPDGGISGRWRWYRQIFGPQMKLNFIRESREGIADQPFLYEHLLSLNVGKKRTHKKIFAALLGNPVAHSASPAFHREFFGQYGIIFVKIPITEAEFTQENLCILRKMGLIFSAVTSPLKKKAFQICDKPDFSARSFQSVNTLILQGQEWMGSHTDQYGIRELFKKAGIRKSEESLALWGGGGLKKMLEKELPFADCYSARTGKKLNKSSIHKKPRVVIWALGRSRMANCVFPNPSWKPQLVVDLNYTENSPGLEYALRVGAKYISGKAMFIKQAKKQQSLFLRQYPLNSEKLSV